MPRKTTKNVFLFYCLSALTFASLALFTHVIPPSYAESWLLWFNYIAILTSISALKYESTIVIEKGSLKSKQLAVGSAIISVIVNLCSAGILIILKAINVLQITQFQLLLIVIVSILGSMLIILANLQLSISNYNNYTLIILLPPALTPIIQVILFSLGFKSQPWFLVGALISYSSLLLIAVYQYLKLDHFGNKNGIRMKRIKLLLAKRKDFALYLTPFTIAGLVRDRFILAILTTLPNTISIAFVVLAQRLIEFSYAAISRPIRPIFFRQSLEHGLQRTTTLVPSIIYNITLIILPAWLLVIINSEQIFKLAFGEKWIGAIPYFIILSPSAFIIATTLWLDKIYEILGKQKQLFAMELIFSILMIVILSIYRLVNSDPTYIVLIMSAINFLYAMCWLANTFNLLKIQFRKLTSILVLQLSILTIYIILSRVHPNTWYNYVTQGCFSLWLFRIGVNKIRVLSLSTKIN